GAACSAPRGSPAGSHVGDMTMRSHGNLRSSAGVQSYLRVHARRSGAGQEATKRTTLVQVNDKSQVTVVDAGRVCAGEGDKGQIGIRINADGVGKRGRRHNALQHAG